MICTGSVVKARSFVLHFVSRPGSKLYRFSWCNVGSGKSRIEIEQCYSIWMHELLTIKEQKRKRQFPTFSF